MLSCPQEYYDSLLCPLLGPLFAYMLQVRISTVPILYIINLTIRYTSFAQSELFLLPNLTALLLFHAAEAQRQVAGHQPEDLCQVSCGASIECVYITGSVLVKYDCEAEEAGHHALYLRKQVLPLAPQLGWL